MNFLIIQDVITVVTADRDYVLTSSDNPQRQTKHTLKDWALALQNSKKVHVGESFVDILSAVPLTSPSFPPATEFKLPTNELTLRIDASSGMNGFIADEPIQVI